MPVIDMNSSQKMWCTAPTPADAYDSSPGLLLASAISSWTVLTPSEGCATSTNGTVANSMTGEKSLFGS